MHPDTREVAAHMREFGLSILGRAISDATFSEMTRPFAHALSVVHAARGAEIVIKARIAEEHPLLIFSRLPALSSTPGQLTIGQLFEHGRSIEYFDLPNVLWAATGYRIRQLEAYRSFGSLRNRIIHFAVPAINHSLEALRFCVEVMEALVHDFWDDSAIRHAAEWESGILTEGYLLEALEGGEIHIPECARLVLDEARN
jgi:hypothetical protein